MSYSELLFCLRQSVVERLFPIFCVECGAEGEWWCEKCLRKIKINPIKQSAVGSLDGLTAFFDYTEGTPLAKLIQEYKYSFARDIENLWLDVIDKCYSREGGNLVLFGSGFPIKPGMIVTVIPVPLHSLRRRERGFNQSEIFAKIILNKIKKDGVDAHIKNTKFVRSRQTRQQAKLSKMEREENIKGAFVWQDMLLRAPENIIIVDDIYTTGSTMQECAKVLKDSGAKKVYGFALAKAI